MNRQAGAFPVRRAEGQVSFCLITTSRGTKWGFPKGIVEQGHTALHTALKETREEAGLHGELLADPVGTFHQRKWGEVFAVEMYLLEVLHIDDVMSYKQNYLEKRQPAEQQAS